MKAKFLILLLIGILSLNLVSCKKEVKKADPIKYSLEEKTTTVNWTAYKTTEKIPVKGIFKTIHLKNIKVENNPFDAINGVEFEIPVNSIDTNNKGRDEKLINSFFGTLKDTQSIKGKIELNDNGKGIFNITMNGISFKVPMNYVISGQLTDFTATLNLDNWKAQLAIDALNKVCNEKHKGKDGISKTWKQVDIHIVSYIKAR